MEGPDQFLAHVSHIYLLYLVQNVHQAKIPKKEKSTLEEIV